jgi:hypothetical protein
MTLTRVRRVPAGPADKPVGDDLQVTFDEVSVLARAAAVVDSAAVSELASVGSGLFPSASTFPSAATFPGG